MHVCFVLPCSGRYPIGGFRIVYEYANRMAASGHMVDIVHLAVFPELVGWKRRIQAVGQYVRDRLKGGYLPKSWFKLDPRIKTSCYYSPAFARFPDADVVVATAWQTAETVARLPARTGRKAYFIQHFEDWIGERERVLATWKLPLHKIVIAKWLGQIADDLGEPWDYVPNAIDHDFFHITTPIEQRPDNRVLLYSHKLPIKGTIDATRAINELRDEGLDLEIDVFGLTPPTGLGLREPFNFVSDPPQTYLREMYNNAAVFVAASHAEGWPLPPAEAMACGAALAASKIGGHLDYLVPGETAEMFDAGDVEGLKSAIRALVTSHEHRCMLAERANHAIKVYRWDIAVERFTSALARA